MRIRSTSILSVCLIKESWGNEHHQQLCDLYIQRLVPRLLMIDGLPRTSRQRLEHIAREYIFDDERFYHLYPEITDMNLMNSVRVEARMRRAAGN